MGWKNVKEHYKIGHMVQVTNEGICIGSPYIHNIIVLGMDGTLKKGPGHSPNDDLQRYWAELQSTHPGALRELIAAPDKFEASLPVYTYEGGEILDKLCEKHGWPNVTHDGLIQYNNLFSPFKGIVIVWAKENAKRSIVSWERRIRELKENLADIQALKLRFEETLAKLERDYP